MLFRLTKEPECYLGQSMCYFNRLTRVACWLADYPKWLQFRWDFVKHPRNDEIALQHFFSCLQQCQNLFLFHLSCMQFFFLPTCACRKFFFKITHPSFPQELNGRPLKRSVKIMEEICFSFDLTDIRRVRNTDERRFS